MEFIGRLCQDFSLPCVSSCCNERDSRGTVSVGCQTEQSWGYHQTVEGGKQIPWLKREEVKEFLQTQYSYTSHRPARRKFLKRKVVATNINDVYQMDLVDMQKFAEFNNGVKYILTVIDCFSRYAFAVPLKSKKPKEIIEAMTTVFKEYGIPLKIFTDKGTEFLNKDVEAFLKELNICQWYSNNPGKAVMAE